MRENGLAGLSGALVYSHQCWAGAGEASSLMLLKRLIEFWRRLSSLICNGTKMKREWFFRNLPYAPVIDRRVA
jgi:hypothetical protein